MICNPCKQAGIAKQVGLSDELILELWKKCDNFTRSASTIPDGRPEALQRVTTWCDNQQILGTLVAVPG